MTAIKKNPKRITLHPLDVPGVGLVVDVTFPFPLTGITTTRRVAITDEEAERLIADVQALLKSRRDREARKALPR